MSHSKRNTSRPVFTSHERALAKSNWTSNSARLNRDSYLPFGYCGLCLMVARDPVACSQGDLFCRECALSNLLTQKKEIKRAEKIRKHDEEVEANLLALEKVKDQERAVRNFELTQIGSTSKASAISRDSPKDDIQGDIRVGSKRKFILDEDERKRIDVEDRAKARKEIEAEEKSKAILPSFWTPSLTPDVRNSKHSPVVKRVKTNPVCPISSETKPHSFSMQSMMTVQFEEEIHREGEQAKRICPSCRKALTNSSNAVLATTCGHVLCFKCISQVLISPDQTTSESADVICLVCDAMVAKLTSEYSKSIDSLPTGLVPLRTEGTGFSARGTNTIERSTKSFQC